MPSFQVDTDGIAAKMMNVGKDLGVLMRCVNAQIQIRITIHILGVQKVWLVWLL
jgi:hypothetical protein